MVFRMRRIRDAIRLQRILRGAMVFIRYQRFRKAVVGLQCRLRQQRAKAMLYKLRCAAKDMVRNLFVVDLTSTFLL